MIIFFAIVVVANTCPYAQYYQFVQKDNIHPYPIIPNPY